MNGGENLFNQRWLDAFSGVLDRVEAAAGPAALVTTGEQKFYSNGMDIDWLATIPAEAGGFLAEVNRLFARLLGFPMATVAAINGHAFGAGAVLAVAHDVIVMREDRGYWCLPEADLGFPITPAMFAVIAAKVPRRSAQEAVLTGRRYGAPEAAAARIVHQVASEDQVLAGCPAGRRAGHEGPPDNRRAQTHAVQRGDRPGNMHRCEREHDALI